MNVFYIVIGEQQADGLSRLTRFSCESAAVDAARKLAGRYPDQCFYVCEAKSVSVSPAPAVETYPLRASVREVA